MMGNSILMKYFFFGLGRKILFQITQMTVSYKLVYGKVKNTDNIKFKTKQAILK